MGTGQEGYEAGVGSVGECLHPPLCPLKRLIAPVRFRVDLCDSKE